MGEVIEKKMRASGVKVLWGMANLTSNRATSRRGAPIPIPRFRVRRGAGEGRSSSRTTWAATTTRCGAGREGYETLLNTDMGGEMDQLGRFLSLVVEHKHKIGFKGAILVEPKPPSRPSTSTTTTWRRSTASCSATASSAR
jgi:xylose isomerase